MKKFLFTAFSTVIALGLASCKKDGASYDNLVLRYAENQAKDYPTTQAAYKFAEMVEDKTDGRIRIQVHYGAELGDETTVIEQIQAGFIDFARVSISPLAEFDKSMSVLLLPYLYKDAYQMRRVLDGEIGDKYLSNVEAHGLVGLSWFEAGARNFYNSKRPITKIEDLAGLKIRVQESQVMMGMIKILGASPVPMVYGEVASALQAVFIDGAENNWPSYESTRHYEYAKYYVLDGHTRIPEMQLASKITLDKLTKEDRDIIRECAKESAKYERELWNARELAAEKKLRASGVEITTLSPSEMAKFQQAMEPLYAEFAKGYEDLIKAIQSK